MTTKISGDNISSIANTGVTWNAVTVADGSTQLNASAGNGYFLDTNAGVIEVFLPSSPTRGDTIILTDYSGTFATNKCIVNTGGVLIDSTQGGPTPGNEFEITTNNAIVELVYVDAAKGWLVKDNTAPSALSTLTGQGGGYDTTAYTSATGGTVTTSGDYKIHTFTGDGCFVVSQAGTGGCAPAVVDYLVVAGGGGTGGFGMGGGGAGGFRVSNFHGLPAPTMSPLANPTGITVTATTYPITVGGGAAGAGPGAPGCANNTNGSPSIFSTITSAGGGYGGKDNDFGYGPGAPGGSGGGGGRGCKSGGTGNTPPTSPSQGNNGGVGGPDSGPYRGAGGGGAGGAGGAGPTTPRGGTAGSGSYVSTCFAVGCVGTTGPSPTTRTFSTGGIGGASGHPSTIPADSGGANTGDGGGGGTSVPSGQVDSVLGGSGGKGIVLIRYKYQ